MRKLALTALCLISLVFIAFGPVLKPQTIALTMPGSASFDFTSIANLDSRWLADDLSGTNNSSVDMWIAKTGTNILSQATAAKQPVLKVGDWNSHNTVLFDGISMSMSAGTVLDQRTNGWTYFIVGSVAGNNKYFLGKYTEASPYTKKFAIGSGSSTIQGFSWLTTAQTPPTLNYAWTNRNSHVYGYQISQTQGVYRLFVDGVAVVTNVFTASSSDITSSIRFLVGSLASSDDSGELYFLNGKIADLFVWSRYLTDTEITTISSNLSVRYNTPYYPGFSPATITSASLKLWLDASQLSATNGQIISTWSDLSSTGIIFTNNNEATCPTYMTNAVVGKPAISFVANNAVLNTTNVLMNASRTMFLVAGSSTYSPYPSWIYQIDGTISDVAYGYASSLYLYGGPNGNVNTAYGLSANQFYVIESRFSPTLTAAWVNGAPAPTSVSSGPAANNLNAPFVIGYVSSSQRGGIVAEVIIYEGVPSDADREAVTKYLTWKYAR